MTAGWGATADGLAYALEGAPADFAVDGAEGTVHLSSPGANRAAILPTYARDAETLVTVSADSLASGTGLWFYAVGRRMNVGTEYRAKVHIDKNGVVSVGLTAVQGGVETALATDVIVARVGTYQPGLALRIRAAVTGSFPTTLAVRVWRAGQPEPASWDLRAEDSTVALQTPGQWGVRGYLSGSAKNAPTVAFDDLDIETAEPDASQVTWSVATWGSDDAAGTEAAPLLTIQHAIDLSLPGDTVLIHGGRYGGFVVREAATVDDPLTITGAPGETVTVVGDPSIPDTVRITGQAADIILENLIVTGTTGYRSAALLTESLANGPIELRDLTLVGNDGYGLNVYHSESVRLDGSEVAHNGTGVQVIGDGAGVVIADDDIHDNDRMMRNTVTPTNDDYGAVGVALVSTTGPVLVTGNRLWGNRAPSHDYGWDGGAFEIFDASGVTISDNTAWDNEDVLETGTDGAAPCSGNRFVRNVAWGGTTSGQSFGIFLRCGDGMLIAHDTLVDLDGFILSVGPESPTYSGSIAGARILDNVFVEDGGAKIYGFANGLPADLTIDNDLLWNPDGPLATIDGHGSANDLAGLQSKTGFETDGIQADPLFVDASNLDYRLGLGSPAIDAAAILPDLIEPYAGAAPDIGRWESDAGSPARHIK